MRLEDIEVIGCAILQDRKYQIIPNIQQTYPYCDKYVLINGGDTEGWVDAVFGVTTSLYRAASILLILIDLEMLIKKLGSCVLTQMSSYQFLFLRK